MHGDSCALAAGVLETGLHCMQVCTEVGVHWSQMCTRDRCLPLAGVHWRQFCTKTGAHWGQVCTEDRCVWNQVCVGGRFVHETDVH